MTTFNTSITTTRGTYDVSSAGGSTVTISKEGSNATLTIDKNQLSSLFQKLTSGENPVLDDPDNESDAVTNNQQLNDVNNSMMDLGELIGEIMALINQENQTYTKEQIAGIASAVASYQASLGQADEIKQSALENLFGSLAMAGISLAMTVASSVQSMRAASASEEVAGSENYQPKSMTETELVEEENSQSKKNVKEDDPEVKSSSLEVESSSDNINSKNSESVQDRVDKNTDKLKNQDLENQNAKSRNSEELVNEKGLTKVERDKLYNQAYLNKTQSFQMWTQFGNMAGQTVEKGFGVGAADHQAQATIRGADSQLANTSQQSFTSNAQQLNSFFESVRSQIGGIMSGQFQLSGKV